MSTARILLLLGSALILASCETPFALKLAQFNEEGPQQPAVITISDPQVYSREALINDRLAERKLLERLLKESAAVNFAEENFTAEIIRELETVEAFTAAARATLDPAKGRSFSRSENVEKLDNQIALTKKRAQLIDAQVELEASQRRLNAAQTASSASNGEPIAEDAESVKAAQNAAADADTSAKAAANSAKQAAASATGGGDIKKTEAELQAFEEEMRTKMTAQLANLDKRLKSVANRFGDRTVKPQPRDLLRDLQSYRSEIRQVLNAVNLDDLHDSEGNALYRLQSIATVMPGRHKDKFGVARLTFEPPRLSAEEIKILYRNWLTHLTYRLNQPHHESRDRCPTAVSSLLRLAATNLFDLKIVKVVKVVKVKHKNESIKKEGKYCTLYLPLPTGTNPPDNAAINLEKINALRLIHDSVRQDWRLRKFINAKISEIRSGPTDAKLKLAEPPKIFKDSISTVIQTIRKRGNRVIKREKSQQDYYRTQGTSSPGAPTHAWKEVADDPKTPDDRIAAGAAYAYSVSPLEHSQRISTSARNARSIELALALAANLQSKGVTAGGKVGYLREAVGMAEAQERQPIVVAFADRRSPVERLRKGSDPVYGSDHQAPQVGLVFGPRARLNTENGTMELIHSVASHRVSADISVPGWWPRVKATLETAWIGNWHDTSRQLRLDDENGQGFHRETFSVKLPLNSSDLDGLSSFLASRTLGGSLRLLDIRHVEPYFISACTRKLEMVIQGANVWRGTEVRLGGLPADDIKVLPDMEGVTATFDLDKLFRSKNRALSGLGVDRGIALVVSTRNGTAVETLRLIGDRTPDGSDDGGGSCIAPSTTSAMVSRRRFEIVQVSPQQICAQKKSATFFVKTLDSDRIENENSGNRPNYAAIFAGRTIDGNDIKLFGSFGAKQIFKITASGGPFAAAGNVLPLSLTDGRDISTAGIQIIDCARPSSDDAPDRNFGEVLGTRIEEAGDKFTVDFRGIDGKLFDRDLRLSMLPDMLSGDIKPLISKTIRRIPEGYEASFVIDQDAKTRFGEAIRNVGSASFALWQTRDGGNLAGLGGIGGKLIFYPDGQAVATVKGPDPLTEEKGDWVITLPKQHEKGFPGLVKADLSAKVAAENAPVITISSNPVAEGRVIKGDMRLQNAHTGDEISSAKIEFKFDYQGFPSFHYDAKIPKKPTN